MNSSSFMNVDNTYINASKVYMLSVFIDMYYVVHVILLSDQ